MKKASVSGCLYFLPAIYFITKTSLYYSGFYSFLHQSYFCSMNSDTGKWIIFIGMFIVLAGVVIYFFHDNMHWIGRLPGDIRVEKENFRFYFPITTLVIFSLLLTLIVQLIRRFL